MISTSELSSPVISINPLGFPWRTPDPFLFCVHHDDHYPSANATLGPAASLAGRNLGEDFAGKDGWRMYHGTEVPGFPEHPHRGFETVTVVRRGLIDHSDSVGATARYGQGDVQWLTAGKGIRHSEMFPLVNRDGPNPLELFQIWLNLPKANKLVEPHFTMLWNKDVPKRQVQDAAGRVSEITVIAGQFRGALAPAPPPKSWAARADSEVAIWTVTLAPGAELKLPPASAGTNRTLYLFAGAGLRIGSRTVPTSHAVELQADVETLLQNGPETSQLLVLQGRPIHEPVVQHGPFVMNTRNEIVEAFNEYQRTGFGGWPWPSHEPVHPQNEGRFARRADGSVERPE